VFVVQPISAHEDEGANVIDARMEFMGLLDAAVRISARRLIAVVPGAASRGRT
jgi:phosphoribosylpyrophosphate synthetase